MAPEQPTAPVKPRRIDDRATAEVVAREADERGETFKDAMVASGIPKVVADAAAGVTESVVKSANFKQLGQLVGAIAVLLTALTGLLAVILPTKGDIEKIEKSVEQVKAEQVRLKHEIEIDKIRRELHGD